MSNPLKKSCRLKKNEAKEKNVGTQKKLGQRGQISFFMVWVLIIIVFLLFFGFMVPFAINFNASLAQSTNTIMADANQSAYDVNTLSVRTELLSSINNAQNGLTESTDNLSAYLQYSWVLLSIIITLIFFVITRQNVERGLA